MVDCPVLTFGGKRVREKQPCGVSVRSGLGAQKGFDFWWLAADGKPEVRQVDVGDPPFLYRLGARTNRSYFNQLRVVDDGHEDPPRLAWLKKISLPAIVTEAVSTSVVKLPLIT